MRENLVHYYELFFIGQFHYEVLILDHSKGVHSNTSFKKKNIYLEIVYPITQLY